MVKIAKMVNLEQMANLKLIKGGLNE